MFNKASKDNNIDLKRSIMIGDTVSDIDPGLKLGMDTMLVLTGKGEESKSELGEISPTYIAQDLLDGAKQLKGINN